MGPRNRLFLLALIIFLLFGTVPAVHAQPDCTPIIAGTSIDKPQPVSCDVAPICYSSEITHPDKVYYYSIDGLVAGQILTIDVDTDGLSSSLDSVLELFDSDGNWLDVSYDDPAPGEKESIVDPYLVFAVPDDGGGTYKFGISADGSGAHTGPYTFFLECSDQPTPSEFKWPVVVGDLIGATGSNPGSLINIAPADAESSLPFPLGVGPIADIEYQFITHKIFVAINDTLGSIVAIDADSVAAPQTFSLSSETGAEVTTVVALEAAENTLYGVQADPALEQFDLVQVIFDDAALTATLTTPVFSFGTQPVWALAYHQSEKILYGVSGRALLKINLALPPFGFEEIPLTGLSSDIASMDFSHEDILYVVDVEGNLYEVLSLTTGEVRLINPINATGGVSSLTFGVGEPPNDDPIKTICSSTFTTSASASSGTAAPKLSRSKLKRNPLHRAVGLFKFQGIVGETVTLHIKAEEEESAEAVVEESSVNELENPWLNYWKGKGRVFLGIRDSIPGLDFRARKKDQLPFTLSATLPADGTYYVMVIRPLLRFYQTDYCLTLESDNENSQAWESFDVAWPSDDSGDESASTSAEEPKDVQNNTETLAGTSAGDSPVPVALSATAIAPTTVPPEEPVVETPPVEAAPVADGGDPKIVQSLAETPVVEPVAEIPAVEPAAETPAVEPVAEIPVLEPVAEIPVLEPVAETPAVEPVAETPVVEPVAETPVVEPAAKTPAVEPVAETPAVEPVAEIPVLEPVAETLVVEAVAEAPVLEPVAEIPVVTEPAADDGSGTESADDGTSDEVGDATPVDEEYSDDPMEDSPPMKG
jgi:hypothetical protein